MERRKTPFIDLLASKIEIKVDKNEKKKHATLNEQKQPKHSFVHLYAFQFGKTASASIYMHRIFF